MPPTKIRDEAVLLPDKRFRDITLSRIHPDHWLLPSVLDRLLGQDANTLDERYRPQRLLQLKQCVRRDLEWLLNTRVCYCEISDDREHLKTSVLNYGIPDFSGLAMGSSESQERLRRRVEDAVRRFETRFQSVRVELVREADNPQQRFIRFRIEGVLYAEPAPVPVEYDSTLLPTIGQFQVRASEL